MAPTWPMASAGRPGERAARLEPELGQRQAEFLGLVLDRLAAQPGIVLGRRRLVVVELAARAGAVPLAEGPAAADVDGGRRPAGVVAQVARPGDHLARHHGEARRVVRHAAEMEVRLLQLEVLARLGALDDRHGLLARHAPLGAVALLLERARAVHGHAPVFGQRLEVELEADADIGVLAEALADGLDAVELVHGVDVDAEPVLHRHLELFGLLVRAVQHQCLGVGAGQQREIHLVDAEAVTARALLVHDVADGEPVARLVGEQDLDVGILGAEGVAELPVGVAELRFGDDEQRRAEAVGQRLGVAILDPQVAVGADAVEFAVVHLVLAGRELHGHGMSPSRF